MSESIPSSVFRIPVDFQGPWGHGGASAELTWTTATRRGLQFDAKLTVDAEAESKLGGVVFGKIEVGAKGRAEVGLAAAFPLDLFDQAGLLARLAVGAEVAAFVQARIGYNGSELARDLELKLARPWKYLLPTLIRHVVVSAGVAGRVGAAAQVKAELVATGALVGDNSSGAGFTFIVDLAVGYGWTAGVSVITDLGLASPDQFINELSTDLQRVITTAASDLPGVLGQECKYVNFAVPFVVRALYNTGLALSRDTGPRAHVSATQAISDSFVHELSETVLGLLFQLGVQEIVQVLPVSHLRDLLDNASADEMQNIRLQISQVYGSISLIADFDWDDPQGNVALIMDLMGTIFDAVFDLLPADRAEGLADTLATVWAVGGLLQNLSSWVTDTEVLPACPESLRSWIQRKVGGGAGTDSWESALQYLELGGQDAKLGLLSSVPEFADFVAWLGTFIPHPDGLLTTLLRTLLHSSPEQASALVASVSSAISEIAEVKAKHLLDALPEHDGEVGEMVHEVIHPLLRSAVLIIERVALPNPTPDQVVQTREMVSLGLLQLVRRLVSACHEVVLDEVCKSAVGSLNHVADLTARPEGNAKDLDHFLDILSAATFGGTPTFDDAADIVRVCADTLKFFDSDVRNNLLPLTDEILSLGLKSGVARFDETWAELGDSSVVVCRPQVDQYLQRLGQAHIDLAVFGIIKSHQLLLRHFKRVLDQWIAWLKELARMAVKLVDDLVQTGAEVGSVLASEVAEANSIVDEGHADIDDWLAHAQGFGESLRVAFRDNLWTAVTRRVSTEVTFVMLDGAHQSLAMEAARVSFDREWERILRDGLDHQIASYADGIASRSRSAFDSLNGHDVVGVAEYRQAVLRDLPTGVEVHMQISWSVGYGLAQTSSERWLILGLDWIWWGNAIGYQWFDPDPLPVAIDQGAGDLWSRLADRSNTLHAKSLRIGALEQVASLQKAPDPEVWSSATEAVDIAVSLDVEGVPIQDGANPRLRPGQTLGVVVRGVNASYVSDGLGLPRRIQVLLDHSVVDIDGGAWGVSEDGSMRFVMSLALEGAQPARPSLMRSQGRLGGVQARTGRYARYGSASVGPMSSSMVPLLLPAGSRYTVRAGAVQRLVPGIHCLSVIVVSGRDESQGSAQVLFYLAS